MMERMRARQASSLGSRKSTVPLMADPSVTDPSVTDPPVTDPSATDTSTVSGGGF